MTARARRAARPAADGARQHAARHQTAFTVSIEAREGVTTGISAVRPRAHRSRSRSTRPRAATTSSTPGHVFPLVARDGGVLVRAGHTEAAVDIARLAGLNPAGVICEIMNDDGTMARLPDLVKFAQFHGLKIGTIADLIAYRRRPRPHRRAHGWRPCSTAAIGGAVPHDGLRQQGRPMPSISRW